MKEILLRIPDETHMVLGMIADKRGTDIESVVRGAVLALEFAWHKPFARQVADLHAQSFATAEIAGTLGVTIAKVRAALDTLQLQSNRERYAALRKAHDEGLTDAEIAARLGRQVDTIGEARRRLGLKPNKVDQRARVAALAAEDLTDREIARRTGFALGTVARYRRESGIFRRPPADEEEAA